MAGRTELAMSIFGRSYGQGISGKVFLHGKEIDVSSIQKAINHGIAYVTEDRKGYGLVLDEPTRGIDVSAKYEIYTIIAQLANGGNA